MWRRNLITTVVENNLHLSEKSCLPGTKTCQCLCNASEGNIDIFRSISLLIGCVPSDIVNAIFHTWFHVLGFHVLVCIVNMCVSWKCITCGLSWKCHSLHGYMVSDSFGFVIHCFKGTLPLDSLGTLFSFGLSLRNPFQPQKLFFSISFEYLKSVLKNLAFVCVCMGASSFSLDDMLLL